MSDLDQKLTTEEFAKILWPALFDDDWMNADDVYKQTCWHCLEKAEKLMEKIEIRWKPNANIARIND